MPLRPVPESVPAAEPVNVMVMEGVPDTDRLAKIGVARISYGPIPYINTTNTLGQEAAKLY